VAYPAIGFGVRQGSRVVERALASTVMPGGVAAYYFAFRLVSAIQTIVGTSVATTSLPRMARHSLAGARGAFLSHMKLQIGRTILISAPLALAAAILARPTVGLLYGRGQFGAGSVELTSQILRIFAFGIVFSCLVPILNSGLYARRKYAWVLGNMLFISGANVLGTWSLSTVWGLAGIALATDLVSGLSVATLTLLNRLGWLQFYEQKSNQSPTRPLDA
jgi:putative peptidoglycan lipid II flippase